MRTESFKALRLTISEGDVLAARVKRVSVSGLRLLPHTRLGSQANVT